MTAFIAIGLATWIALAAFAIALVVGGNRTPTPEIVDDTETVEPIEHVPGGGWRNSP